MLKGLIVKPELYYCTFFTVFTLPILSFLLISLFPLEYFHLQSDGVNVTEVPTWPFHFPCDIFSESFPLLSDFVHPCLLDKVGMKEHENIQLNAEQHLKPNWERVLNQRSELVTWKTVRYPKAGNR